MSSAGNTGTGRRVWGLLAVWGTLVCAPALALDYHVDAVDGQDTASGTAPAPAGVHGPWRTLEPVARTTFHPGDRLLLKCGQTFQGPVKVRTSRLQGEGHVLLAGYGTCDERLRPVVTGARPLGISTLRAGELKVWKPGFTVGQVQVDGQPLMPARHPASGWFLWPHEGEATDPVAALTRWSGRGELTGARARIRSQEWLVEERLIRAGGPAGAFDTRLQYPLRKGVGVMLAGKAWMIGASPSWAWDDQARTLSLRMPPGSGEVTASPEEPLLDIQGDGSVALQQWRLSDAGGDAMHVYLHATLRVKNLVVEKAALNGMLIRGVSHASIEDSQIDQTGRDAIVFHEIAQVSVKRNRIAGAGMWGLPGAALAAINAHRTERATIEENWVDRSAYIGIRYSGNATIRRNIVTRTCLRLSDCGAIYTWRLNPQQRLPGGRVENNTVVGVKGDTSVTFTQNHWFAGIYLDNFTRDMRVSGNVVVDAEQGIYLNQAIHNEVRENVVFGSRERQLVEFLHNHPFKPPDRAENELRDNVLLSGKAQVQWPAAFDPAGSTPVVLDMGSRKLALGWTDWNQVDWDRVSPGCRPLPQAWRSAGTAPGEQPTSLILQCSPKGR